ncbi:MAG: hypothetical protein NC429_02210 [Lachnospiraceae bacterium]|nr:hypothetical protein [Lachnospiraceae bacterium]
MRKFIKKTMLLCTFTTIFLLFFFCKSNCEPYRSILAKAGNAEEYDRGSAMEILPYIDQARAKDSEYTKLIIGDSVCHQIFNSFQKYNDVYNTLGSNQAITMAGQYLLMKEFVENHPRTTNITLVARSLNSGIGLEGYTYQYLIIPFTEAGMLGEMTMETLSDLEEIYGGFWLKPAVVSFIDYSPIVKKIYLNSLSTNDCDGQQFSFDYLVLMLDICEQNDIEFHLLHAPMPESAREAVEQQFANIYEKCTDKRLLPYMEQFYESVTYYPDEYFSDGIHFGTEYNNEEDLKTYINGLVNKDSSLTDFKVD